MKKKFLTAILTVVMMTGCADAAKWKEFTFTEDVSLGLAELAQYCNVHDVKMNDIFWANSVTSADITAGKVLYLPANHAELLAIWQHTGAWQPTALVPVTSAAAAKRAVKDEPVTVKTPPSPPAVSPDTKEASTPQNDDDIMAKLREEVKVESVNFPKEPVKAEKPAPAPVAVQPEKTQPQTNLKIDTRKRETPEKVIANTAKPDKILTSKRKPTKPEIPGLMDPIIILSPNGDPSKGPMRLVISGDKVEVVQLPKSAAPKRPSLSDLDHTFGTTPSYLPHYNVTPKKRDPFILNMGNLAGKMLWPVDGKVSSPFGKWRGNHRHQGIDIPMPAGTPIRAAKNGVVSRTGNNSTMGFRGYGNFILMDHGDDVQTFYAHCLSVTVIQGQRIMQGQIIGYVGSTGRSTANHLHFEVRVGNNKVDPMRYLAGNSQLASTK